MSRSIHQTRKSAQQAFREGNLEPTKQYSLKADLKKWTKKRRKAAPPSNGIIDSSAENKRTEEVKKTRNSVLMSALKKVKKPLAEKLDKMYSK